jgi:hypothetical protein
MTNELHRDTVEKGSSQRYQVVPLDGAVTNPQAIKEKVKKPIESRFRGLIAADGTLRCRFEFKYYLSEAKAAAVEKFIMPYIHPDRYCKLQPSGSYPIVSLYLDSPDMKLCRESITGKQNRFKLRIRGYSDDPGYPKFFEIKRRLNTIIVKDRHRVSHRDVPKLLCGGPLPLQYYSTEQEALKQFLYYRNYIDARPLVLVRYNRRAFEDDSDTRVRVTFDRQLSYKITNQPEVVLGGSGWQIVPINGVILEIKFTSKFPAWLTRMVKCLEIQQQSFSKYVHCVNGACSLKFGAPEI